MRKCPRTRNGDFERITVSFPLVAIKFHSRVRPDIRLLGRSCWREELQKLEG